MPDLFRQKEFFYHEWAFYGPWFTGAVASLEMIARLTKVINCPESLSLFHPRALEQVIGDFLTHIYSRHVDITRDGIHEFKAPSHWQPLHHLPVNAVWLQVKSEDFSPHRTILNWVFFPIADHQMMSILFRPSRFKNLPRSELDKRVSAEPLHELMENIINGIELELSPEAKAQQTRALEGLEDTSLTKDYPPLKWERQTPLNDEPAIHELPGELYDEEDEISDEKQKVNDQKKE